MRLTQDKTDLLEHRAKVRRRVFLSLFAVFLLVSLLLTVFIANQMLREYPPDNLPALREASGASAVWYFRHRPLPESFREYFASELPDSRPQEPIQQVSAVLHPVGQILVFDSPDRPGWVLIAPVRRPQRVFQEFLARLLATLEQEHERGLTVVFDSRRVLVANDPRRLEAVHTLMMHVGPVPTASPDPQARILAPDGPYLRYEGPWRLLPSRLRDPLEPQLGQWPSRAAGGDWPVRIEWLRAEEAPRVHMTIPTRGMQSVQELAASLGIPDIEIGSSPGGLRAEIDDLTPFGGDIEAEPTVLQWRVTP